MGNESVKRSDMHPRHYQTLGKLNPEFERSHFRFSFACRSIPLTVRFYADTKTVQPCCVNNVRPNHPFPFRRFGLDRVLPEKEKYLIMCVYLTGQIKVGLLFGGQKNWGHNYGGLVKIPPYLNPH